MPTSAIRACIPQVLGARASLPGHLCKLLRQPHMLPRPLGRPHPGQAASRHPELLCCRLLLWPVVSSDGGRPVLDPLQPQHQAVSVTKGRGLPEGNTTKKPTVAGIHGPGRAQGPAPGPPGLLLIHSSPSGPSPVSWPRSEGSPSEHKLHGSTRHH